MATLGKPQATLTRRKSTIRVGRTDYIQSPLLRTVRAVLPHTDLWSVGSDGLSETHVGRVQA